MKVFGGFMGRGGRGGSRTRRVTRFLKPARLPLRHSPGVVSKRFRCEATLTRPLAARQDCTHGAAVGGGTPVWAAGRAVPGACGRSRHCNGAGHAFQTPGSALRRLHRGSALHGAAVLVEVRGRQGLAGLAVGETRLVYAAPVVRRPVDGVEVGRVDALHREAAGRHMASAPPASRHRCSGGLAVGAHEQALAKASDVDAQTDLWAAGARGASSCRA